MRMRTLAVAAVLLACTSVAGAVPNRAPARNLRSTLPDQVVANDQAVELVETVPVETAIGNPALRSAHDVWVEAIRGARGTLDFEEFYLSAWPGEPLDDVVHEIVRAAQRGVQVRLLLDAKMSKTYPHATDSLARVINVQVRFIDIPKFTGGGVQHSKFFLVDGHGVYLGSQNLDWRSLKHIHELGAWIQDYRVARVFQEVYDQDWRRAGPNPPTGQLPTSLAGQPWYKPPFILAQSATEGVAVMPSFNPRGLIPDSTLWDRDAIERLLDAASGEIALQVLTYSTESYGERDTTLQEALARAAGRGVKVRMLISDWNVGRRELADLRALARSPNVEVRISTVPEWSGGYVPFARVEHCKYMVVDTTWTWVGTSNWEPNYFSKSRNVAVTLKSPVLSRQARDVFEASWKSPISAPLKMEGEYPRREHGETPPPGAKKYGG